MAPRPADPMARARIALDGLSVGDAFGERFFDPRLAGEVEQGRQVIPPAPWPWTDDTAMALSVLEVLRDLGEIREEPLARAFASRFQPEPDRGYGRMTRALLEEIGEGGDWRALARSAFGGQGSMGNGAAMRVGPVGAFFADDLARAAANARQSATVTHTHPEGAAGAVAVAIAAAAAADSQEPGLLETALAWTPAGETRRGLEQAATLPFATPVAEAARRLGNGSRVTSPDTVPFALWCAARHLGDFPGTLWATVAGGGDRDTTSAIAGGVAVLATGREGIPGAWLRAREPLPEL